jgi:ABC-2 type transport system permease protein
MLARTCTIFRAEMTKVWRTKFPYLGLLASALMALIAKQSIEGLSQPGEITAPSYFAASVNMSTTIAIPLFATIFSAMLVASETSRGTLRMLLTRPITRAEFLTAKLAVGTFYLLLLFAANLAVAAVVARGYPIKAPFDKSIDIPGVGQQVLIFAVALGLSILPQLATVCFGFFVSVLSNNVASAIGVAVGVLLSLQPVKHFIRWGAFDLDTWLFSSYYDTAMGIADSKAGGMLFETWRQEKIYLLVLTSVVSAVVLLAISYRSFLRRDLNT